MNWRPAWSTMFCEDTLKLYKKMQIKSDAIIINQTLNFSYKEERFNDSKIKIFNFDEKGVGLSRNSALMRASKDICVISDDDMVYVDNCDDIIKNAYLDHPDADMIVFNVIIKEPEKERKTVLKSGRVRWYNCLRYGAVTFTFKRKNIQKRNIYFSQIFGGGTEFGSGEDSLFIWTILKNKMKVYAVDETIATVYNFESSWFEGYNEKYFKDKGMLYKTLSPNMHLLLFVQFLLKHRKLKENNISFFSGLKLMIEGSKNY